MKAWKTERCSTQPDELQLIAPDMYIQRRNITEVEHEADETTGTAFYTDYECESREISVSEYETLASIEEIDSQKAVEEYTLQLMEEGVI